MSDLELHAGQRWAVAVPSHVPPCWLIIGAIVSFDDREAIVCCAIDLGAASASLEHETTDFLPLSRSAFLPSVTALDGTGGIPAEFAARLQAWDNDPKGRRVFTVPFDGRYPHLLARQMMALMREDAA